MVDGPATRLWNRSFTVLWLGLLQSYLGDAFLAIGLMWLVLEKTGSPAAAGTILALQGIPKLFGPLAGAVVDRSSKRRLMIGGDLFRAACLLGVYLLHVAGRLAVWELYVVVVALSAAALFYGPSLKVLLPALVPDDRLPAANSLVQAGEQVAMIGGATLAGVTLAAFGTAAALLIDGITFVVAAAAIALVRFPPSLLENRGLGARTLGRDLVDGFRFVLGAPEIIAITIVLFASNLVLSPVNVLFPILSREVLGQGVKGFGFLASALGAGFLAGSIVAGALKLSYFRAILGGLLAMSASMVGLSMVHTLSSALMVVGLLGAIAPLVQVSLVSRLQRSVPKDLQGRVFAMMGSLVAVAAPLGAGLAGQALARMPVSLVFRGTAGGLVIVAAIWGLVGARQRETGTDAARTEAASAPSPAAATKAIVRVEALSKTYNMGEVEVHALREVDLEIREGEMVAIMGASGSGKSTMLNILGTLDSPTSGRYLLDGEPVEELDEEDLAHLRNRKIGFVFQAFNLLPRETALANVELPMVYAGVGSSARRQKARRALERVGLADREAHLPTQLSGGQQQRISIARALVNDPRLLLADEPTGALDSANTLQIMDLLRNLHAQGMTVVLVTHDAAVAAHADRVITFKDGQIIDDRSTGRAAAVAKSGERGAETGGGEGIDASGPAGAPAMVSA